MTFNNTQTTLTITPPVGAPAVYVGGVAIQKLRELLQMPSAVYTYDKTTGVYTGSYGNGSCCNAFSTTQANAVVTIVLDPILCVQ